MGAQLELDAAGPGDEDVVAAAPSPGSGHSIASPFVVGHSRREQRTPIGTLERGLDVCHRIGHKMRKLYEYRDTAYIAPSLRDHPIRIAQTAVSLVVEITEKAAGS